LKHSINYRFWLRTDRSLFYGAEQYVVSAVSAINSSSTKISADLAYLSLGSRQAFAPFLVFFRLLALALANNKPEEAILDVFQFPFFPPFCRRSKLPTTIICFHHADLINGTPLSRFTELAGLLFLMLYKKDVRLVCVSRYWLSWLNAKGFNNVTLILNPISNRLAQLAHHQLHDLVNSCSNGQNIPGLSIAPEQLNIYLGIARKAKGWLRLAPVVRTLFPSANIFVSSPNRLETIGSADSSFAEKYQVSVRYFADPEDLYLFLTTMQICIFASEFREGWNRTLLEASILCNGLTFALSEGGMQNVAELAPWIMAFGKHRTLYKELRSISCVEGLTKQINASIDAKAKHLSCTIDVLSISRFVHSWELLAYE